MKQTYIQDTKNGYVFTTINPDFWSDARYHTLSKQDGERLIQEQSRDELKSLIDEGAKVYTILRHVSDSYTTRHIDLMIIRDNIPTVISYWASKVLGYKTSERGGIVIRGGGEDMGFRLVYNLGSALFNDGYALKHEWI